MMDNDEAESTLTQEPVAWRVALEKISGRRDYDAADHQKAARYKPEAGLWTTNEYLADAALDGLGLKKS